MSITGDLIDTATTVDQVTLSNLNNILSVKNYGLTQLQMANNAIYDRSIVSMAYSKITSSPQQLVDLISLTPTLNYTLGTNGTNIILRSPTAQLTAVGGLPLTGGTMSGNLNLGTKYILNAGLIQLLSTTNNSVLNIQQYGGGANYNLYLPAFAPNINASTPTNLVLGINSTNICTWMNPETQVYKSFRIGSGYGNTITDFVSFGKTAGTAYTLNLPGAAPASNTYLKWDSATSTFIWATIGSGLTSSGNITITGNDLSLNTALTGITSITGLSLPTNATDAVSKTYVDSFAYVTPAVLTSTLAGYLTLSGGTMTGNITMGTNKVTGLPTPTVSSDAVPKGYVDTTLAGYLQKTGGTMTGILTMNANIITGVGTPINPTDAINRIYADGITTTTASNLAAAIANYLPLVGGTLSGNLSMGTHRITNVLAPVSSTDAANKATVDAVYTWVSALLDALLLMYLQLTGGTMTGVLNMNNNKITNLPNPTNSGDGVNKAYVDLLASGFSIKPIVQCLMSTTGGYTYSNGIAGFGATLTKMNSTAIGLNIDSYILSTGDRILVNTTVTSAYNGVYQLTTNGISGQNTVLTRASDSDGTPLIELHPGATFFVQNGAIYGGYQYTQTSVIPSTIGTDSITYSAITSPSSVTAGNNIIVYQNLVELNPTVTGLNSIQLTSGSGFSTISKAIGSANYSLVLPSSGSAGNQFLVFDVNGLASWTTAPSSGGTYTAGSNLTLTSGVFSVNSALTAINSIQLKEANSSGLVILGKVAGSASYSLNLPAAAPTTNTYLKYDGADYTWSTAGSNLSSLIACQFIHVSSVSPVSTSNNSFLSFNQMVGYSGNTVTLTSPTQFTLLPGFTYKCSAMIELVTSGEIVANWYSVTGSVIFGSAADAGMSGRGNLAVGFITPSVTTIISLQVLYSGANGISGIETYNKQPWAVIEVVSSNVAVAQFTGATDLLPGTAGFIPAPQAGTQNSYLRGDGNWVQANNAPTAAQYYMTTQPVGTVATYNTLFAFSTTPVMSAGTAITQISATQFQLAAGYTYKLTGAVNQSSAGLYETICQWTTSSNLSGVIGVAGDCGSNQNQTSTATAYLNVTVVTIVGLAITYAQGASVGNAVSITGLTLGRQPWALIEVVSNNNTITAFGGATSSTDGSIGYIPKPLTGQQNYVLTGSGVWSNISSALPAKSWYTAAGDTSPIALISASYMTFPLGVAFGSGSAGSAISKVSGVYVYQLAAGSSYKVRFFCDIYTGSSATGLFYIVKSSSSTLPTSPSTSTDSIGNVYQPSSLSSYYKVQLVGNFTPSVTTYIGVRYGGTANGAQIANAVLEINLL